MIQHIFDFLYRCFPRSAESLPVIGFIIINHSLKKGIETLSQQNPKMSLDGVVDIFFSNLELAFSGVYQEIADETGKIMNHYEKARKKLLRGIDKNITVDDYFNVRKINCIL